jgi:uncharacterized protein (TIGR00106 family)
MSEEVAAAFDAISKIQGVKATLTALGTQIEAENIDQILEAIKSAHGAARNHGSIRIISSIRIDERLDKSQTFDDKVRAVRQRLE